MDVFFLPFLRASGHGKNKNMGWEGYLPHDLGGISVAIRENMGLLFYRIAY